MRVWMIRRHVSIASGSLIATLVAAVCASCGSKTNRFPPGDGPNTEGSPDSGDDATVMQCFGNCDGSGSGNGGNGIFGGGPDGGGSDGSTTQVTTTDAGVVVSGCPGPLTATTVSALQAATSNSTGMKWLYPYDQTVFPGGLAAPIFQWSQTGTPDGVYVHLHSSKFDYKGCYSGSNPPELQLDQTAWVAAFGQSGGTGDPLVVELSTTSGGIVSGPISETLVFAGGNLAGDVYYNTYGSKLVPGQPKKNGAVIKIARGQTARAILYTSTGSSPLGPCISCHSLSSNGAMLVAQQHKYPDANPLNGNGSMSFDLTKTPMPSPMSPLAHDTQDDWGLSAVYPDGTMLLTSGEPMKTSIGLPIAAGDNPGMIGPKPSTMYDTNTGATISFSGLTTEYAMMPMFSPDGKHVVYNDAPAMDAGIDGHTLTVMDFDMASKTFSNPMRIFHDDTKFPGWPFFTPDAKQVIFSLGNSNNFATEKDPPIGTLVNSAQLYVVDVATAMSHRLDETSGYDGSGAEYLPFPGRDENIDFFPTVNPVSAGGYFWVYFTSRRAYGNLYPGANGQGAKDIGTKAIWVSAIDIDPTPGTDPSHPAFYLPGQELGSGNIRAFAVLAPCQSDGATCESGFDCCGGSCTTGVCGVPPAACAGENDKCTATIPCCNMTDLCIGGYCGFIAR
jgi:hypothetical protein